MYKRQALSQKSDIIIDGLRPEVDNGIFLSGNAGYGIGDSVIIALIFSEPTYLTGQVGVFMVTGNIADYYSGSGSDTLEFLYIVTEGDNSTDLGYFDESSLYTYENSALKDSVGNESTKALVTPGQTGSLMHSGDIIADGIRPNIDVLSIESSNPYLSLIHI